MSDGITRAHHRELHPGPCDCGGGRFTDRLMTMPDGNVWIRLEDANLAQIEGLRGDVVSLEVHRAPMSDGEPWCAALSQTPEAEGGYTDEDITQLLNAYPEVRWDRFVESHNDRPGDLGIYGWIDRPDGRADFVLYKVPTTRDDTAWFTTSSPTFNNSDHLNDCQRVEDRWSGVKNAVRLAEGSTEDQSEKDLETTINEAIGAASTCWTGAAVNVFDSTRATVIAKRLLADVQRLTANSSPPTPEDGDDWAASLCLICGKMLDPETFCPHGDGDVNIQGLTERDLHFLQLGEKRGRKEASEDGGWQPIETVPKDGTRIIACDEYGLCQTVAWSGYEDSGITGDKGLWWSCVSDDEVAAPIYWMPLPAPPTPDAGSAQ